MANSEIRPVLTLCTYSNSMESMQKQVVTWTIQELVGGQVGEVVDVNGQIYSFLLCGSP